MSSKLSTICMYDYVKVVRTDIDDIITALHLATCHFSQVCQHTNLNDNAMVFLKWQFKYNIAMQASEEQQIVHFRPLRRFQHHGMSTCFK